MAAVKDISSESEFTSTVSSHPDAILVIYFHAPWAAPCRQMLTFLTTLAGTYPVDGAVIFLSLNAEEVCEVAEEYDVTAVPYFVIQQDGKTLDTISGSDVSKVRAVVEKHAGAANGGLKDALPPAQTVTKPAQSKPIDESGITNGNAAQAPSVPTATNGLDHTTTNGAEAEAQKERLFRRLKELVEVAPVMLFMKGTPSSPQCGFSRRTVGLLREHSVRYGFFNILADDEVRQGLKEYADWPTFPQLWVNGELVGGLDIVRFHSLQPFTLANHL